MASLTLYGTQWCSDCKRTKQFLGEQRVRYNWVDVESDPDGLAFIEQAQDGGHSVPTLRFDDGTVLVEPSNSRTGGQAGPVPESALRLL